MANLYVFHQGINSNGQLWYKMSSDDGVSWSADKQVPNVGMTGAPAAVVTNAAGESFLRVFHQGFNTNGQLWSVTLDSEGLWGEDTQLPNVGITGSPATPVSYNGKLYVFHQGTNNNGQLWYKTSSDDGVSWSADTQVPNVGMTGSPAAVVTNAAGESFLRVFHQGFGNDGQLWAVTFNGASWGADTQLPNVGITGSPSTPVSYNGNLYVFHQGANNNGQLWYKFSSDDGVSWSADTQVPNVGMTGSPSAVVTNAAGESFLRVFHQGFNTNGQLWAVTFNGTGWGADTQVPNVGMTDSPNCVFF